MLNNIIDDYDFFLNNLWASGFWDCCFASVFFLICFPQSSMLVKYSKLLFVSVGCVKDAFIKE